MHFKRSRVGIDVSKASLDACAESPTGERQGKFENNEAHATVAFKPKGADGPGGGHARAATRG